MTTELKRKRFKEFCRNWLAAEELFLVTLEARRADLEIAFEFAGLDPELDALLVRRRALSIDVAQNALDIVHHLKARTRG